MDSIKLTFNTPRLKKLSTIYIIEDNPIESSMLVDFLSKYPNLTIKEFTNGDACIKDVVMSKVIPDLIFLDYFLDSNVASSKDGLEILAKLKEVSPNSEFIMLTSVDNERIVELARKKGAMGYIVKGVSGYEKLDSLMRNNFAIEEAEEGSN
jgi:DNA-binding NarL/FixJ family response regulator